LRLDTPDLRVCRLTNKRLSNKSFDSNSFRQLQIDEMACKVWMSIECCLTEVPDLLLSSLGRGAYPPMNGASDTTSPLPLP
jgi:hypothetical protein